MSEEQQKELNAHQMAREEKKFRKTVRKRVVIEEEVSDRPDPKQYEPVTFRVWNEQQRGVPQHYCWVDKWVKPKECEGYFHDGGTYTLPRIAFEYYKEYCATPRYSNVDQELIPGQTHKVSRPVGKTPHFRFEVLSGNA